MKRWIREGKFWDTTGISYQENDVYTSSLNIGSNGYLMVEAIAPRYIDKKVKCEEENLTHSSSLLENDKKRKNIN